VRVIFYAFGPSTDAGVTIDGSNELPGLASDVSVNGGREHANEGNAENEAAEHICALSGPLDRIACNVFVELDIVQVGLILGRELLYVEVVGNSTHDIVFFVSKFKLKCKHTISCTSYHITTHYLIPNTT